MGVYLSEPNKDKHGQQGSCNAYSFVSAQMQGWRKNMEDAAIHNCDIGDGNGLFAVFDGHGGFQVSKYVADIFTKQLTKNNNYKGGKFKQALDQTFQRVDELIKSQQGQVELNKIRCGSNIPMPEKKEYIGGSVGCTANVLLITPKTYYIANSGDSRSVLSREGKAVAFSEDHKPENPIQQERIRKAGGQISMGRVNGGLNLSRSFGDFDYKNNKSLPYDQQMITCKPDIKEIERKANDQFVIMGCDGIWQNYVQNNQGMIDIIRQQVQNKKSHRKIVEDLLDRLIASDTMSGIGCDNMTAILIVFK